LKKLIIISTTVLVVLLGLFFYGKTYYDANKPKRIAFSEAQQIASNEYAMKQFDQFYYYSGNEAWNVITGKNEDNQAIGVWISRTSDGTKSLPLDGLTEQEAIGKLQANKDVGKIKKIVLGMEDDEPLWEITYLNAKDYLCYYYVDYYTGEMLRSYDNVIQ